MRKHLIHTLLVTFILSTPMLFAQCNNQKPTKKDTPVEKTANYTPSDKDLPIETLTELKTAFPQATFVELTDTATYAVKNASGEVIGTVLLSSPFSDKITGFNGPTPLQIAMDTQGKIVEVRVLDNQETPKFLNRVINAGFLKSWNGLTAEEALNKEVDAVSGATYSSNGIKNSLKARFEALQ